MINFINFRSHEELSRLKPTAERSTVMIQNMFNAHVLLDSRDWDAEENENEGSGP
jgi:hypothetical protein